MRINYWDSCKGLAIIAVVAIHASSGTGNFKEWSFNWLFGLSLRQLIDFAVPLFLAMSGYFSEKSPHKDPLAFYKSRATRILVPYIIWTMIYIALKNPYDLLSAREIIKAILLGTGIEIGYFVIVLFQFILITPALAKIQTPTHHIAIIIAATLVGSSFTYYYTAFHRLSIFSNFPANAILFFVWYPFYHAGYFISRHMRDHIANKPRIAVPAIVYSILLACALIEGLYWAINQNYPLGVSQLKATSLAASFALFIITLYAEKLNTPLHTASALSWLGKNSYAIYLTHMLPLIAARKFLKGQESIYNIQPLSITIITATSITACTLLIYFSKRFIKPGINKAIFGN